MNKDYILAIISFLLFSIAMIGIGHYVAPGIGNWAIAALDIQPASKAVSGMVPSVPEKPKKPQVPPKVEVSAIPEATETTVPIKTETPKPEAVQESVVVPVTSTDETQIEPVTPTEPAKAPEAAAKTDTTTADPSESAPMEKTGEPEVNVAEETEPVAIPKVPAEAPATVAMVETDEQPEPEIKPEAEHSSEVEETGHPEETVPELAFAPTPEKTTEPEIVRDPEPVKTESERSAATTEQKPEAKDMKKEIQKLKKGERLDLGDGRIAYKVKPGDTFSQICKKVIGTGAKEAWQAEAKRQGIDYRKIYPGKVLYFLSPNEQ